MKIKEILKKIWNFYWKDESILSYAFFLVTTVIMFKYIIFPLFLLITGLSDVVAIMSNSMEHTGNEEIYYYQYFQSLNYSREEIDNFPYSNGLYVGDVVFVKKYDNYSVGDVIVFKSKFFPAKLVHRIVSLDPITTKGDNNPESYIFDKNIDEVVGKVVFRIPYLGIPRYWLYRLLGI